MRFAHRIVFAWSWLLALSLGCQDAVRDPAALLGEGERAYAQQRYAAAIDRLSAALAAGPAGPQAARARYVRGMALALNGQRASAYSDLEIAARETGDRDVGWRANAVLGVLRFEDGDWAVAAHHLDRATALMPGGPPQDALLFRLGMCQERTGRWSDARAAFDRIVTSFPTGVYAERAGRRLQLGADYFAVQAGVFSQVGSAERLAQELRGGGLDAYVRREARGSQEFHVVLVGRYDSYATAMATLRRVRGLVPEAVIWP